MTLKNLISTLLAKTIILSFLGFIPTITHAQDNNYIHPGLALKDMAREALNSVAQKSERQLEGSIFNPELGFAESNLLGLAPVSALAGVGITKLLFGTTKLKSLKFAVQSALWTWNTSFILFAGNMAVNFANDLPNAVYMPVNGHFRAEIHYTLASTTPQLTKNRIEGTCLFFFTIDEEALTADYEIDECTHQDIFPQEVPGTMRIGDEADKYDVRWGQTLVVAKGRDIPLSNY